MTGNTPPSEWKVERHSRQPNRVLHFELTSPSGDTWDAYVGPGTLWTFVLRHITPPSEGETTKMVAAITGYVLHSPLALEDMR